METELVGSTAQSGFLDSKLATVRSELHAAKQEQVLTP